MRSQRRNIGDKNSRQKERRKNLRLKSHNKNARDSFTISCQNSVRCASLTQKQSEKNCPEAISNKKLGWRILLAIRWLTKVISVQANQDCKIIALNFIGRPDTKFAAITRLIANSWQIITVQNSMLYIRHCASRECISSTEIAKVCHFRAKHTTNFKKLQADGSSTWKETSSKGQQ